MTHENHRLRRTYYPDAYGVRPGHDGRSLTQGPAA